MDTSPSTSEYLRYGLGYGLSKRNQNRLQYMKIQERQEAERRGIEKVRELIEWAHTSFESVKAQNKKNMRIFTDLTINWSPERVLTTYKNFAKMCAFVKQENIWKSLDRHERRFIADSYALWLRIKDDSPSK